MCLVENIVDNHWSGWKIVPSTVKIVFHAAAIAPLSIRRWLWSTSPYYFRLLHLSMEQSMLLAPFWPWADNWMRQAHPHAKKVEMKIRLQCFKRALFQRNRESQIISSILKSSLKGNLTLTLRLMRLVAFLIVILLLWVVEYSRRLCVSFVSKLFCLPTQTNSWPSLNKDFCFYLDAFFCVFLLFSFFA